MQRDLAARVDHVDNGRPGAALNLSAREVMEVHDQSFLAARIPVNAWTPREYLDAAHRYGAAEAPPNATPAQRAAAGEREMNGAWQGMLDNNRLGVDRGLGTMLNTVNRYNDEALPAANYMGRMTAAYAAAAVSRSNQDPDRIGTDLQFHQRRDDGQWFSISVMPRGLSPPPPPREERNPVQLRGLEDTRQLRLDIQDKRDDFHPLDPARTRGLSRSPITLAEAVPEGRDGVRLASSSVPALEQAQPPLYASARSAVVAMEQGRGRTFDVSSEKLAQAGALAGYAAGMDRIDHAVISTHRRDGQTIAGENLIVVQGVLDDPAHVRAAVRIDEALARTPAEQAQKISESHGQRQVLEARLGAPLAPQRDPNEPDAPNGPRLG